MTLLFVYIAIALGASFLCSILEAVLLSVTPDSVLNRLFVYAGEEEMKLVEEMLAAGMNVARINCAHDDPDTWTRMIANVRSAAEEAATECRIMMDLAGPKLRTGELDPGPGVIHIRPKRDPMGRVIAPRRVRLIPDDAVQRGTKAAVVPVSGECIEYARVGDEIRLRDTRGKKRRFPVVEKDDKGIILETVQGAYIATGTRFTLVRSGINEKLKFRIGELPPVERPLLLHVGDTLIIDGDNRPGRPAGEDADGNVWLGYNDPAYIAERHGIKDRAEVVKKMSGALNTFSDIATGAAE